MEKLKWNYKAICDKFESFLFVSILKSTHSDLYLRRHIWLILSSIAC